MRVTTAIGDGGSPRRRRLLSLTRMGVFRVVLFHRTLADILLIVVIIVIVIAIVALITLMASSSSSVAIWAHEGARECVKIRLLQSAPQQR